MSSQSQPTQSSCQTCLSDLRGPPAFVPPCCEAPVCATCVAANPRLTTWVPCLRCGAAATAKPKTKSAQADVAGVKKTQVERPRAKPKTRDVEEQFVLVGDDDSGDEGAADDDDEGGEGNGAAGAESGGGESAPVVEAEPEIVEIKHTLRRGDTLLSIARAYATDPHTLLSLNDLPHAALYANPALIRTRKSLVVSRRLVNARDGGNEGEGVDVTETPERKAQRAMRRFQSVAKAEEGVARAYLALHESRDAQSSDGQAFHRGLASEGQGGDVVWSFDDDPASPAKATSGAEATFPRKPFLTSSAGDAEKKPADPHAPGVDGALEHYFDDEAWEAGAARPARGRDGRWRVVGAVLPQGVKAE